MTWRDYFNATAWRGYHVVYYGIIDMDMTSPSACTWIVPGTVVENLE